MKYAFIGLPSCGKTTLAKNISRLINGTYIPEMARQYIKAIVQRTSPGDQYLIAKLQSNVENELHDITKRSVCDVPVYLSAIYDHLYNNQRDVKKILKLAERHDYNKIFYLTDTPEYVQDNVRYQSKEDLYKLEKLIDKYNSGRNIVRITDTDSKKRMDKVLENILE
jgi:nicotinamide riboside kinase